MNAQSLEPINNAAACKHPYPSRQASHAWRMNPAKTPSGILTVDSSLGMPKAGCGNLELFLPASNVMHPAPRCVNCWCSLTAWCWRSAGIHSGPADNLGLLTHAPERSVIHPHARTASHPYGHPLPKGESGTDGGGSSTWGATVVCSATSRAT
jgi:hypothetical protein